MTMKLQRKLPATGWTELEISRFLDELSSWDSNNHQNQVGVGEREGRVVCPLVSARNRHTAHGIGRSGDVTALQPKAAGSSVVNQLTNALLLHSLQLNGIRSCKSCFLVPTATGMALLLCLLYFKKQNPKGKYVVWSRIDQKTCVKCITSAGLIPLVVQLKTNGDELTTDLQEIERLLSTNHDDSILCVMSTACCFAPRIPDSIDSIALLCQQYNTPHLVNNAYGLQSSKSCHMIEQGCRLGRVDVFVQSTDKNYQVPVGGAVIAGPNAELIGAIAKTYPGRASLSPTHDVLSTLLWWGVSGWTAQFTNRALSFQYMLEALSKLAHTFGERVLHTKHNQISLALTLSSLDVACEKAVASQITVSELGSMLFHRRCSGARVVVHGESRTIEGVQFDGWGAHSASVPCSYLNVAAAVGITNAEIDIFIVRLEKCLSDLKKRLEKETKNEIS